MNKFKYDWNADLQYYIQFKEKWSLRSLEFAQTDCEKEVAARSWRLWSETRHCRLWKEIRKQSEQDPSSLFWTLYRPESGKDSIVRMSQIPSLVESIRVKIGT